MIKKLKFIVLGLFSVKTPETQIKKSVIRNPLIIKTLSEIETGKLPDSPLETRKCVTVKVFWHGDEKIFFRLAENPIFRGDNSLTREQHRDIVHRFMVELESFGLYTSAYTLIVIFGGIIEIDNNLKITIVDGSEGYPDAVDLKTTKKLLGISN